MGESWTPERVETLRVQWAAGINVRLIAGNLGVTKGVIIGKARRLNLGMHAKCMVHPDRPPKPLRKSVPRTRYVARNFLFKPRQMPPPEAPDALNIAFNDLEYNHCRYAVTRDKPFLFCGVTKDGDSSYCAFHHALCHEKPKPRIERLSQAPYARAA